MLPFAVAMGSLMLAGAFAQLIATGPAIGAPVPRFEAADQNGEKRTMRSLMGPKGAILVFYRSADW